MAASAKAKPGGSVKLRVCFVARSEDAGPSCSSTPGAVHAVTVERSAGLEGLLQRVQRCRSAGPGPFRLSYLHPDAAVAQQQPLSTQEQFETMCDAYTAAAAQQQAQQQVFRVKVRVLPGEEERSTVCRPRPCNLASTPTSEPPLQKRARRAASNSTRSENLPPAVLESQLVVVRAAPAEVTVISQDSALSPSKSASTAPSLCTESILRSIIKTVDRHHSRFIHSRLAAQQVLTPVPASPVCGQPAA